MVNPSGLLLAGIYYLALGIGVWAAVDSVIRPTAAYPAAGKLTKPAWVAITAVAVVLLFVQGPLGLLGLVAIVASIVYLVDVRPAVRELRGGSSDGPYGPYR